jgi:hypothetical protein
VKAAFKVVLNYSEGGGDFVMRSSPLGLTAFAYACLICAALLARVFEYTNSVKVLAELPYALRESLGEKGFDLGHFRIREAQVASAHDSFRLTRVAGADDRSGHCGMVQCPSGCDFSG